MRRWCRDYECKSQPKWRGQGWVDEDRSVEPELFKNLAFPGFRYDLAKKEVPGADKRWTTAEFETAIGLRKKALNDTYFPGGWVGAAERGRSLRIGCQERSNRPCYLRNFKQHMRGRGHECQCVAPCQPAA